MNYQPLEDHVKADEGFGKPVIKVSPRITRRQALASMRAGLLSLPKTIESTDSVDADIQLEHSLYFNQASPRAVGLRSAIHNGKRNC